MGVLDRIWRRSNDDGASVDGGRRGPATATPVPRPRPAASQAVGGFAVFDVETTGLVTSRDRVVELAVVTTDLSGQIMDEWTTLVNPEGAMGATRIHGITAAEVRRAPRFAELIGELNARLAGRALAAHNAPFDLAFLGAEYERAGWSMPAVPYLCTLAASRDYLPALDRRRLTDCCCAMGIGLTDAHSALGDARATAALLRSYLDHGVGRPPQPGHVQLPGRAVHVEWPRIPRHPVDVARRRPAGPDQVPAEPGVLAALLDDLPLSAAVDKGAPADTTAYLELLAEVLEDGVLTDDEAASLAGLAGAYSLTRTQVEAAHRGFLLALADKAVSDGKVTHDERRELIATAQHLGFPTDIVKAVLGEARAVRAEQHSKDCRPIPVDWPHGEPLRIGDGVAFTGCDDLVRARLEGRARAAGLRVTGAVSGRTVVLVTDGSAPSTNKAEAARRFRTRVVHPDAFTQLVEYVQPALSTARAKGASGPFPPGPGQRV
ncbi:exonuclease domain-containing protein [Micromonospora sp. NBC_01813]|uniref:exonuclease domain-containing protein n=1 Tax=Micromonospora sp. NBC_01813 TaxID=2975988 RepID=UPI002DDC5A7A|nr:exonuclease domain-containing protein [Micromonospora sp. NBC_01813]WSA11281.1 exonuclease domain-containing protein [Micromonospora sp. NBC_01813]